MSKLQGLSTAEKILLAEELWDSALEDESSIAITEEQKNVLDGRLDSFQSDRDKGSPWEVVKKRILNSE